MKNNDTETAKYCVLILFVLHRSLRPTNLIYDHYTFESVGISN